LENLGIGTYLARLGQRTIQTEAPIILAGASAINKLLGKKVNSSNVQLGGLQVTFRNGVSHIDVADDYKGTCAIIKWLSYVPLHRGLHGPVLDLLDPIDRDIQFMPSKTPYNPVDMLAGITLPSGEWVSGFFDQGSFTETLAGWAKTVNYCRARLGGKPMGVITVEMRTVENIIPADPANAEPQEQAQMQALGLIAPTKPLKRLVTSTTVKKSLSSSLPTGVASLEA
jgi:acetyl-CoA carboxylase / biotin carboxylase 1